MSLKEFSREQIEQKVQHCTSLSQLAKDLNYNSRGAILKTIKTYLEENNIDYSHFTGRAQNQILRTRENVFVENSTADQATLRRWYHKENIKYKCAICNQNASWQGKPLTLILDHIDGNNHNDVLTNLRWVCPNCNVQLNTFCKGNY